MYKDCIEKILSKKDVFNTFIDCCVAGEESNEPYGIKVKFVGTSEEAKAWIGRQKNPNQYRIYRGRFSRKGTQVIENSNVLMEDVAGKWYATSAMERKTAYEYEAVLLLLPTGEATFNHRPYVGDFYTDVYLKWYVEDNIITMESGDCGVSYRGMFNYSKFIPGKLTHLSSIEKDESQFNAEKFHPQYLRERRSITSKDPDIVRWQKEYRKHLDYFVEWEGDPEEIKEHRKRQREECRRLWPELYVNH